MNCDEIQSFLAAWVDGELEEHMHAQVEAHLDACAECRQTEAAYHDMQQAIRKIKTSAFEDEVTVQAEADLAQSVQVQILAEENAILRQEVEQMRQMMRELKSEVNALRRQVSNTSNSVASRDISHFGVLMPGTPPMPTTNSHLML